MDFYLIFYPSDLPPFFKANIVNGCTVPNRAYTTELIYIYIFGPHLHSTVSNDSLQYISGLSEEIFSGNFGNSRKLRGFSPNL
jgi:hypothetical protein